MDYEIRNSTTQKVINQKKNVIMCDLIRNTPFET